MIKKIILGIISFSAVVGLVAGIIDLIKPVGKHKPYGPYERFVKRGLDALLSTGALIVLSPVLFITAILVRFKLGLPVLFTQERPGKDEKVFKLYKFRTMTDQRDENGELLPDADRLTKFGAGLRSTSLDERVIIGQNTESLENKGLRKVSPIHFHRGHDLFFYNARDVIIKGVLCQSA